MSAENQTAHRIRDEHFSNGAPVKVSICTITFNHAGFIEACLDSLLDQACDFRVEIIVHDDASTDGTAEILEAYAEKYPRTIKPVFQHDNQYSKGVNPYYAFVFPQSQGEYIAICDGDDYWDQDNKLEAQVKFLDSNPDVAITYGRVKAVDESGDFGPYRNGAERDVSSMELKIGVPLNTVTTCFRNIFQKPPPPFMRNSPIGDMTVWAQLGYIGTGHYMPELAPAAYRLHSQGILSSKSNVDQNIMNVIALFNIAAYHWTENDRAACAATIARAIMVLARINGAVRWVRATAKRAVSQAWIRICTLKGPD